MADYAVSVLGSLLEGLSPPTEVDAHLFVRPGHRAILGALKGIHADGLAPDPILVMERLRDANEPEALWVEDMGPLVGAGVASLATFRAHLTGLRRQAARRDLKAGVARLMGGLNDGSVNLEGAQAAVAALADIARGPVSQEPEHIGDNLTALFSTPLPHVPLGLSDLSHLHVVPGNLLIVGARPGVGKSALLASVALSAGRSGWRALYLSLEMPSSQIRQRMLSALSGIPLTTVVAASDPAMLPAAQDLKALPIWVQDATMKLSLARIESLVGHFARKYPERAVVFLDYVQLVTVPGHRANRYQEVGEVSRGLKALALSQRIPIIAAAQLKREAEGSDTRKPRLSDLRESGDLEQDADQVLLLNAHEEGHEMNLVKYRMGATTGWRAVHFHKDTCHFRDYGGTGWQ
jgi:replicative DNA helicase